MGVNLRHGCQDQLQSELDLKLRVSRKLLKWLVRKVKNGSLVFSGDLGEGKGDQ